jgi:ATP-binding cassette, subfamily B, bacterial MsbA
MLTTSSILLKFAKEHPVTALIYVLTVLLVPIQDVGLPHLYGRVINAIQQGKPLFKPFASVLGVIFLLQMGILITEWNETFYSYPALQTQIRRDLIDNVFKTNETNFDEQESAMLIAKLIKLPTVIFNLVEQYKIVLIPQTIVCIIIMGYITWHDTFLGALLLIVTLLVVIAVNMMPSVCQMPSVKREVIMNTIHEETDDILRNMASIYNANSLTDEQDKLDGYHEEYRQESKDTLACIMRSKYVLVPAVIIMYAIFMWRCYNLVKSKKLATGTFVSLFLVMMSLMGSLNRYVNQIKELVGRRGVIEASLPKHQQFVPPTKNTLVKHSRAEPLDHGALIEFADVKFGYEGSKGALLSALNFAVKPGERLLIKGRIGTGKSTILKLLMKYKVPTEGEIYLSGVPYSNLTPRQVRQTVGYVPQTPILFNRSIYDNIIYGSQGVTRKDVVELLRTLKVDHIINTFPEGIDANVGKNGSKLSGGQRQIVWILRVLLQNPRILLLDEPTASIDEKTKEMVAELLKRVMENRTVIMVSHDHRAYLDRNAASRDSVWRVLEL